MRERQRNSDRDREGQRQREQWVKKKQAGMSDISHDAVTREARTLTEQFEPKSHSGTGTAITSIFKADTL